jgi:predicted metal-binding protein
MPKNTRMEKYIRMAKNLKMIDAKLITPEEISFDIRAMLKCRWGCDNFIDAENIKCDARGTSHEERMAMIKKYAHILMLHAHDAMRLSAAVLEIERTAFLDGHYFAFGIRSCCLCKNCFLLKGESCPTPEKIRPCDQLFAIDAYKTARNLGLPIQVLQKKSDIQNRYGFVLID